MPQIWRDLQERHIHGAQIILLVLYKPSGLMCSQYEEVYKLYFIEVKHTVLQFCYFVLNPIQLYPTMNNYVLKIYKHFLNDLLV